MAENPPRTSEPNLGQVARQKATLTVILLLISASAIVTLFVLQRFPLPVRVFLVTGDLIVLSAIWLILRQKFSGK